MILTCRIEVPVLKKLITLLFVSASAPALAHLTWIDVGEQSLGLSTGHNFPAKEITVKGEYVQSIRCTTMAGELFELGFDAQSIRYVYPKKPANCVAKLKTTLIELTPAQGVQHFSENKVSKTLIDQVRATQKFEEEYFKLAQIRPVLVGDPLYNEDIAQFVSKPDDPKTIYVYKNGEPVPNLPVGLEYPETPITLWSNTDAEGKVKLILQPTSKALLRALITEQKGSGYKSQFLSVILEPR
ncbi:hypothetical protein [Limnobacter alexandrii]|uniref:hypothetical protein n=1 Tax=Limnobacter alexandrii TaxID=2570352 RepID=UPI001BB23AE4|nr:hypothetical protein [Limnobacter alexandrii]